MKKEEEEEEELRVVNGPTSSGPNPIRTRKLISSPNQAQKTRKLS